MSVDEENHNHKNPDKKMKLVKESLAIKQQCLTLLLPAKTSGVRLRHYVPFI
jgi:hypothetical protein